MVFLVAQNTQPTLEEKIASMVWKNRLIVLYSSTPHNQTYQRHKEWLNQTEKSLLERDLVIVECPANTASKADVLYLTKHFKHNPEQFGIWLIGKDGGLKLSSKQATAPQQLFDLIDSMPMRQAEMNKKKLP